MVTILERFAHCALRSHLRSPTPHSASTTSRRVLSDLGYRNEDFDTEGSGVLISRCAIMCYMKARWARVGVRELRQNLSVYLRRVVKGESFEVTDRGRAVAILAPLPEPSSPVTRLVVAGRASDPQGGISEALPPRGKPSRRLSEALQE